MNRHKEKMKINDKSLAKFATSGAPADKEGYLLKRGEYNKGYQRRWFVLKGNLLFYYDKRHDKDPIGVVILEGCTIELSEDTDGFVFQIKFSGSGNRTYLIAADSQVDMEAWMKVLSRASYDYMKLMVSELHRQLQDLNEDARRVENAMRDSLIVSGTFFDLKDSEPDRYKESEIDITQPTKRFNPFNTSDENLIDSANFHHFDQPRLNQQSFAQLHNEYGQEIKCMQELWNARGSCYGSNMSTSCA
jgi:hypothetical protein